MARYTEGQIPSPHSALVINPDGVQAAHTEYVVMPEFRVAESDELVTPELLRVVAYNDNGTPVRLPLQRLDQISPQIVLELPKPIIKDITPAPSLQILLEPIVGEIDRAASAWEAEHDRITRAQVKSGQHSPSQEPSVDWLKVAGLRMDPLFYPTILEDKTRSVSVQGQPTQPVIGETPLEVADLIQHVVGSLAGHNLQIKQTATVGHINFTEVLPSRRMDPLFIWDSQAEKDRLRSANRLFEEQERYACMAMVEAQPPLRKYYPDRSGELFFRAKQHGNLGGTVYLTRAAKSASRTFAEVVWLGHVLHGGDGRNILRGIEIFQ